LVGIEAIYAAASLSLATLEILVHFVDVPNDYTFTTIDIPDAVVIEAVPDRRLPRGWNATTGSTAARTFGAKWALELRSAVLSVPSSIVRAERIFVINPMHPDLKLITFSRPKLFRFDPRLK
jgi:RES domain-containing protein